MPRDPNNMRADQQPARRWFRCPAGSQQTCESARRSRTNTAGKQAWTPSFAMVWRRGQQKQQLPFWARSLSCWPQKKLSNCQPGFGQIWIILSINLGFYRRRSRLNYVGRCLAPMTWPTWRGPKQKTQIYGHENVVLGSWVMGGGPPRPTWVRLTRTALLIDPLGAVNALGVSGPWPGHPPRPPAPGCLETAAEAAPLGQKNA